MSTTLAQISVRSTSALIKKISGRNDVKLEKFGITRKGQPWVSYSVDGKKCSQFLSKKEWDFTKSEVLFLGEISSSCCEESYNGNISLSLSCEVLNLRKGSRYSTNYYRRSESATAVVTNCNCIAGQFKKSCKHQLVTKHFGDHRYDSLIEKSGSKFPSPVPAPVRSDSDYVHPIQKECDRVWGEAVKMGLIAGNSLKLDNSTIYIAAGVRRAGAKQAKYAIDSYSYGTFLVNTEWSEEATQSVKNEAENQAQKLTDQRESVKAAKVQAAQAKFDQIWSDSKQDFVSLDGRKAKRISLAVVSDFDPYGTGYMIFELNHGNYLVKKVSPNKSSAIAPTTQPQAEKAAIAADQFKIPGKIAAKVAEIRSQSAPFAVPPAVPSPSGSDSLLVFGSGFGQSQKVYWVYIGEDSWSSTLGGFCKSSELEANVRIDLSLGHEVFCRTSKADYFCSFNVDNKVSKVAIPRSA